MTEPRTPESRPDPRVEPLAAALRDAQFLLNETNPKPAGPKRGRPKKREAGRG